MAAHVQITTLHQFIILTNHVIFKYSLNIVFLIKSNHFVFSDISLQLFLVRLQMRHLGRERLTNSINYDIVYRAAPGFSGSANHKGQALSV